MRQQHRHIRCEKAKKMSRNDNVNDDDDGLGDNTKFRLKLVCLTFYYYSRGYIWCTRVLVRYSNKTEENCLFKFNENKQTPV